MTATNAMTPAKRGDLVVIVTEEHNYVIGQPSTARERVEVGVVTSVTRSGGVKRVRTTWEPNDHPGRDLARFTGFRCVLVCPRSVIDVDAAMTLARAHHWPGHPTQPKPFDSVRECKEALRPALLVATYRDTNGHLRIEPPRLHEQATT